jgi:valyl-tRNA synthetase
LCKKVLADLSILGPDAATPNGCAVFVIAADVVVLVDIAGAITDIDSEIKKLHTKLQKSQGAVEKQKELMNREGFADKVSEVVIATEQKKLADAEAAIENYNRTLEQFEKMKIGS